jgi:hypothetical protein
MPCSTECHARRCTHHCHLRHIEHECPRLINSEGIRYGVVRVWGVTSPSLVWEGKCSDETATTIPRAGSQPRTRLLVVAAVSPTASHPARLTKLTNAVCSRYFPLDPKQLYSLMLIIPQ